MNREEWKKICPHCGNSKKNEEAMCAQCKKNACPECGIFTGDGSMCEDCQRNMRILKQKSKKKLNEVNMNQQNWDKIRPEDDPEKSSTSSSSTANSDTSKFIFAIIVSILVGVGTYIYFKDSLWVPVNLIISAFIGFCVAGSIAFFSSSEKGNVGSGFAILILAIGAFSITKGCWYVSPSERAFREEKTRLEELAEKERIAQFQKKNEEEAADFARSNQEIKVYGAADNQQWALTRAKSALKRFAHAPDSVTDVEALSQAVRIRMKQYPQCRYALQVQFRAKNQLGALILQRAVVLFDKDWNGFMILEKSPF